MIDLSALNELFDERKAELSGLVHEEQGYRVQDELRHDRLLAKLTEVEELRSGALRLQGLFSAEQLSRLIEAARVRSMSLGDYLEWAVMQGVIRDEAQRDEEAGRMDFNRPPLSAEELRARRQADAEVKAQDLDTPDPELEYGYRAPQSDEPDAVRIETVTRDGR